MNASLRSSQALAAVLLWSSVYAFSVPSPNTRTASVTNTRLFSTAALPKVVNGETMEEPTAWDCDEEANCKVVPACDEEQCRTSLDIRIHNTWYDLSGWRKAHPGGEFWLDWYDGRDATEVMDAFHSEKGRSMYQRLPKSKEQTAQLLEASTPADTETQIAFRKLREDLEKEGYWERDMVHEYTQIGLWALFVAGAALTTSVPVLSASLLGISMTAAGWLGHDYIHGVDDFANRFRNFAATAAGLSATWWSDKHNKHHALTNEQGN